MSKTVALPLILLSVGIFSATCTVGCGSSSPAGGTGGAAGGHTGTGGAVTGSGGAAAGGHAGTGTDAGTGGSGTGGAVDSGTDVRADATDASVDTPRDVATDIPADVRADVPADVPADIPAAVDVRPDVAPDVGADVTVDTGAPDVVDASTIRTYQVPLLPIAGIPAPSTGSGMATVVVNTATGTVNTTGTFTGLTSAVSVGHVHDNTGAALTPFTLSNLNVGSTAGSFSGTLTLTAPQITSLTTSGLWYVNIHSTNNGAGEIRGFIGP